MWPGVDTHGDKPDLFVYCQKGRVEGVQMSRAGMRKQRASPTIDDSKTGRTLRRRLQEAPRRVQDLESRLDASHESWRAHSLRTTNWPPCRGGREQLSSFGRVDKLTSPPNNLTVTSVNDDGTVDIMTSTASQGGGAASGGSEAPPKGPRGPAHESFTITTSAIRSDRRVSSPGQVGGRRLVVTPCGCEKVVSMPIR